MPELISHVIIKMPLTRKEIHDKILCTFWYTRIQDEEHLQKVQELGCTMIDVYMALADPQEDDEPWSFFYLT